MFSRCLPQRTSIHERHAAYWDTHLYKWRLVSTQCFSIYSKPGIVSMSLQQSRCTLSDFGLYLLMMHISAVSVGRFCLLKVILWNQLLKTLKVIVSISMLFCSIPLLDVNREELEEAKLWIHVTSASLQCKMDFWRKNIEYTDGWLHRETVGVAGLIGVCLHETYHREIN